MKLPAIDSATGAKVQMASLIDVVFLLMIYFMVTATLIKKEADLSFLLPLPNPVLIEDVPIEIVIEIQESGKVRAEGIIFAEKDRELNDLVLQLEGLKTIASTQGSDFSVTLHPHGEALHYRIIDVMDACAKAGVEYLGFSHSFKTPFSD